MLMKLAALACVVAQIAAQGQTYVVDLNNGPGTHFVDLQAAIQAVPDGSSLWVRAGNYPGVTIAGKGLTLLGLGSATVDGLRIVNTAPPQPVAVSHLGFGPSATIEILNAAGAVSIDAGGAVLNGQAFYQVPVWIEASRQVHLRRFHVDHGLGGSAVMVTNNSFVVLESCVLFGSHLITPELNMLAAPAVVVSNSTLQLVETTATGGNGGVATIFIWLAVYPGVPGIVATNSVIRILGNGQWVRGGVDPAQLGGQRQPAITGSGVVRADPTITLDSGTGLGITLVRIGMPRIVAVNPDLGGSLVVRRSGPSNVLTAIVASLRGTPWPLQTNQDPIWIDAPTMIVDSLGVTPSNGQFQVSRQVPNSPALRGFVSTWQAVDLDVAGQLSVSNPTQVMVGN